MAGPPLPPVELANRVGPLVGEDGSYADYEEAGRATRDAILCVLPPDWTWTGKRVLDFGCGAGRTWRHFLAEAADAEFHGCDIDARSIDWLNANLSPPLHGFVNHELPPLPQPDGSFDLIYALSVFTHIADAWAAWLLELHRVLAPGGLLVASFLGEGMCETLAGEPWQEERIGMNVLKADQGWDLGGPTVLMSPWWIREHWGRAFAIVAVHDGPSAGRHGTVVARRRPDAPTRAELERIDPSERREITALRHNIRELEREAAAVETELARVVEGFETSWSWRLTAPLRWLVQRVRTRRYRGGRR